MSNQVIKGVVDGIKYAVGAKRMQDHSVANDMLLLSTRTRIV